MLVSWIQHKKTTQKNLIHAQKQAKDFQLDNWTIDKSCPNPRRNPPPSSPPKKQWKGLFWRVFILCNSIRVRLGFIAA